jgi:hypothetical protein
MGTYIKQAIERFAMADLSKGLPYRNLVGCLMWIACSVFGTILVRVNELARHCNAYTDKEYQLALKLLHSLDPSTGIIFIRGGANRERVPQLTRNGSGDTNFRKMQVKGEFCHLLLKDLVYSHLTLSTNSGRKTFFESRTIQIGHANKKNR